jgi:hypothetical protein
MHDPWLVRKFDAKDLPWYDWGIPRRRSRAMTKEEQMKYLKILGLVAMALIAVMAIAGTASADYLTSPKGSLPAYTSTVKAEAETTVTLTSIFGGFGAVSCKKSIVEGTVKTHSTNSGVPVTGNISTLTFGECSNPVTVINKGSLSLTKINEGEATLRGIGQTITIHETLYGTCFFKTDESLGTVTGTSKTGTNATLDIKAQISDENECGTGTWHGSYRIVNPSFIYFD